MLEEKRENQTNFYNHLSKRYSRTLSLNQDTLDSPVLLSQIEVCSLGLKHMLVCIKMEAQVQIKLKPTHLIKGEKQCNTQSKWFLQTSKLKSTRVKMAKKIWENMKEKKFATFCAPHKNLNRWLLAAEINSLVILATREQEKALTLILDDH